MPISLIGHDQQIAYLNASKASGRLGHAYLFHGPNHVGKLTIAHAFAQSFFCSNAGGDMSRVCGDCQSCRMINESHHPNVTMLDTDHTLVSKKETRKEIPIEDIRALKQQLSYAPAAHQWRLAIINEADKMSEEAANAFLKLLEEPGTQTLLILVAAHKDLLLPTIVSRVQSLRFLTVSDAILTGVLDAKRIANDDRKDMLLLAGGRPGILMQLCEDSDAHVKEDIKILRDIEKIIHTHDLVNALRISEQSSQDTNMREKIINWLVAILRAKLVDTAHSADAISTAHKITRVDYIANLIDSTNVHPRLAMDVMFLECM